MNEEQKDELLKAAEIASHDYGVLASWVRAEIKNLENNLRPEMLNGNMEREWYFTGSLNSYKKMLRMITPEFKLK